MMTRSAVQGFCVDGTNLVRVCAGYGGPAFRVQEESDARVLLDGLAALCAAAGEGLEIEVFFDGAPRPWRGGAPNLRVRFTEGDAADSLILDRVRARRFRGERVTVVTADAELGRLAEEEGGRWLRIGHGSELATVARAIERRVSR